MSDTPPTMDGPYHTGAPAAPPASLTFNVIPDDTSARDDPSISPFSTTDPTSSHTIPNPSHPNLQFRSSTIPPSSPAHIDPSARPTLCASPPQISPLRTTSGYHHAYNPASITTSTRSDSADEDKLSPGRTLQHRTSSSSLMPVSRTPSLKKALASSSLSSASGSSSYMPSPVISALGEVTPLPSPLLSSHSPGPWRRVSDRRASLERRAAEPPSDTLSVSKNSKRGPPSEASERMENENRREGAGHSHSRNRSISLYVPDPALIPKRHATVTGGHPRPEDADPTEPHMRREAHLAESRGHAPGVTKPPTPPPSDSSKEAGSPDAVAADKEDSAAAPEVYQAYDRYDGKKRRWRAVRFLGQGTFSRVMLATSQMSSEDDEHHPTASSRNNTDAVDGSGAYRPSTPTDKTEEPCRKTLVAVKVCEYGPRGGADEKRIEMSLKRELEIMKSMSHPSLVHLKAWSTEASRMILVLSYCAGGDLFDVATGHKEVLTPPLVRRMFAELVGAVRYLHGMGIVHRDIKLENVLVNVPPAELADPNTDWTRYPHALITLTDLGLSRRVAEGEKLETRCGSEDYAAPEIIMAQPYDGKATDAWSLGVLLYALLEARMPFDADPSEAHRMRSRKTHRIARVDWRWVEYGCGSLDDDGEGEHCADAGKFRRRGLEGARAICEGLLKRVRSRWTVDKVAEEEWVRGAMALEGGLTFREEEEGEEVS